MAQPMSLRLPKGRHGLGATARSLIARHRSVSHASARATRDTRPGGRVPREIAPRRRILVRLADPDLVVIRTDAALTVGR